MSSRLAWQKSGLLRAEERIAIPEFPLFSLGKAGLLLAEGSAVPPAGDMV